jgi:hypothetical protein
MNGADSYLVYLVSPHGKEIVAFRDPEGFEPGMSLGPYARLLIEFPLEEVKGGNVRGERGIGTFPFRETRACDEESPLLIVGENSVEEVLSLEFQGKKEEGPIFIADAAPDLFEEILTREEGD